MQHTVSGKVCLSYQGNSDTSSPCRPDLCAATFKTIRSLGICSFSSGVTSYIQLILTIPAHFSLALFSVCLLSHFYAQQQLYCCSTS